MNFETLKGLTLKSAEVNADKDMLTLTTIDDREFIMFHSQDCCESVTIEDIVGTLNDVIGSPITLAEAVSSTEPDEIGMAKREKERADFVPLYEGHTYDSYRESETWTFYKLATIKGSVTIRWYGTSNGYYSESVQFIERGTPDAEWYNK